jgi:hypothetical protein
MLLAESAHAPIITSRRRWRRAWARWRSPSSFRLLHARAHPPLPSSTLYFIRLDHRLLHHRWSLPPTTSPSKAGRSTNSTSPSSSATFELEPLANAAPRAPMLASRHPTKRSPTIVLLRRSPTKPAVPRASMAHPGSPPFELHRR